MVKREFEGIVKRVEWKGEEVVAIYAERRPDEPQFFWPFSRDHQIFHSLIGKKVKVTIEEVAVS